MFYLPKWDEAHQLQYAVNGQEAVILSYQEDASHVQIPDEIDGIPVTCIEAGAFSGKTLRFVTLPAGLKKIEHHAFSECRQLDHVTFPKQLISIGNYAFYNCYALKQVHFPPRLRSIGFGAFMNCDQLTSILQDQLPGCPLSLGSLLDDLTHRIHLEVHHLKEDGSYETAMVTFTEYTTDMTPDLTAISSTCKQFVSGYTGSGRNLRFCVSVDGVDYAEYDRVFVKVLHMDSFDVTLRIAMERLMYPRQLSIKAKAAYLEFLRDNLTDAVLLLTRENALSALHLLCTLALLDAPAADAAIDTALKLGFSEIVSCLMDYRHQYLTPEDEDFEL